MTNEQRLALRERYQPYISLQHDEIVKGRTIMAVLEEVIDEAERRTLEKAIERLEGIKSDSTQGEDYRCNKCKFKTWECICDAEDAGIEESIKELKSLMGEV